MDYYPEVVQAIAAEDHAVYAYFSDGSIRKFDVSPLVAKGGVFERLSEHGFFLHAITVMNGTVAWDVTGDHDETRCIDIDPLTIYENSVVVPDPLGDVA